MSHPILNPALPLSSFGERKVTIYFAIKKHEATQLTFQRGHRPPYQDAFVVLFKPKAARRLRYFVDHSGQTVVLDGWGHPDFDWLLRSLADAPWVEMRPGVSVKTVSCTIQPGGDESRDKYQLEFEHYVRQLKPAQLLLNTRSAMARND
jgi:hypothetical protein